ncbi:MAG TPA: hypothetical protein VEP69_05715 [Thermodesulfovibrionales bacterium]|nr:hypothetical protein [Thermodesulfovibrionales bacterium]
MEPVKVIIRYLDGRLIKGFTNDFSPNKPQFHVRPADAGPTDRGVDVQIRDLKAVFFVKDFAGDPAYHEKKEFSSLQQAVGRKMEVTFKDGEVMVGSTMGHDPKRPGFFLTPADPQCNMLRVYIIAGAVTRFRFLQ